MEIIVDGWRAGADERKEANRVPVNQLPTLTDEQNRVVKKMGISEEINRKTPDHLVLVRSEHIQALDIARGQATPSGSLTIN